ncbi:MAG: J domain-containing protein [Pseudomonadota bacterium]|nr:J domain-containing protein [Pseudomonadota bacterium]
MAIEAFPLQWPQGWERTKRKETGLFKTSFAKARDALMAEIYLMGGKMPVLSSNIPLRRDGLPYAKQAHIDDPGIAVYFEYKKRPMCFACDRYTTTEANTQSIRKTIEALRGIERWGASNMMERAFTGFAQLGHDAGRQWWDVLGVPSDALDETITDAYMRRRSATHPDKGGDANEFAAVQRAYQQAMEPSP